MNTTENNTQAPAETRSPVMVQQGALLRVRIPMTGFPVTSKRGGISEFSARSRKRMLETMACLDDARIAFTVFVTLTYPDGETPPSPEQSSRDIKTFFKRLKNRFPETSGLWRREWEERKSGDNAGDFYPHFHILFFNIPFLHYREVNRHWCEVLGHSGYLRTDIQTVRSRRHAFSYVAKYMAKVKAQPPKAAGIDAPSGERRRQSQTPSAAGGCSLVYIPYRAADEEQQPDTPPFFPTGRHWGVFNRKHLPLAQRRTASITFEQAKGAKERARLVWQGIDPDSPLGFTLFFEDADALFDCILADEDEGDA